MPKRKLPTRWSVVASAVAAGKSDAEIAAAYQLAFGSDALLCVDYLDSVKEMLAEHPEWSKLK